MISTKFLIAVGFSQCADKLEKLALAKHQNWFLAKVVQFLLLSRWLKPMAMIFRTEISKI